MRTFIAIDFPGDVLEKIVKIVSFLRSQTPEKALKWVDKDNLHLTLKFLGEIREDILPDIQSIMTHALQGRDAFKISIGRLGMYPNHNNPRVVWLGVSAEETLFTIQRKLDLALQDASIPSEKRAYSPHLTIARLRRDTDSTTIRLVGETLSQIKVDSPGSFFVRQIRLYQSQLTSAGPIYFPLLTFPLNQV